MMVMAAAVMVVVVTMRVVVVGVVSHRGLCPTGREGDQRDNK
jgi:hypothetical protein